jgi:uncharacterized membrane protein YhdT
MKAPFSYFAAALSGILILIGYFFPIPALASVRAAMLQWAVILAGFALLVGVINLIKVHMTHFKRAQKGRGYSLVLILSFLITLVVAGGLTPTHPASIWIFTYVQFPLEASLLAILSVILLYAAVRLLRRRMNSLSVIFLISAVVVLLGSAPLFFVGQIDLLTNARDFLVQVVSVGGARGILLGVALGTLATGVRILIGSDRPYNG